MLWRRGDRDVQRDETGGRSVVVHDHRAGDALACHPVKDGLEALLRMGEDKPVAQIFADMARVTLGFCLRAEHEAPLREDSGEAAIVVKHEQGVDVELVEAPCGLAQSAVRAHDCRGEHHVAHPLRVGGKSHAE